MVARFPETRASATLTSAAYTDGYCSGQWGAPHAVENNYRIELRLFYVKLQTVCMYMSLTTALVQNGELYLTTGEVQVAHKARVTQTISTVSNCDSITVMFCCNRCEHRMLIQINLSVCPLSHCTINTLPPSSKPRFDSRHNSAHLTY